MGITDVLESSIPRARHFVLIWRGNGVVTTKQLVCSCLYEMYDKRGKTVKVVNLYATNVLSKNTFFLIRI